MQLIALAYELCIGSLICTLCMTFNVCINYSTCPKNTAFKASRPVPVTNPFDLIQIPFMEQLFHSLEHLLFSSLHQDGCWRERPRRSWSAPELRKPEESVLEFILEEGHDLEGRVQTSGSHPGLCQDLPCQSLPPPVDSHYLGKGRNST